jgi:hypothetical protein
VTSQWKEEDAGLSEKMVAIPCKRAPEDYEIGYKMIRMITDEPWEDGKIDPTKMDADFIRRGSIHVNPFFRAVMTFGRGRNICATTGGYLGSVPYVSAIGDMICILFGGSVPFVIRECTDGCFRLGDRRLNRIWFRSTLCTFSVGTTN